MFELQQIMAAVHELAALAWPDELPLAAVQRIIDVQEVTCRALGLPEDLDLIG